MRNIGIIIFLLLLTACAPSQTAVQTAIAETDTAKPTETIQPTETITPTPTIAFTNTPAFTPTPEFCNKHEVETAYGELWNAIEKYDNARTIAQNSPRLGLAAPISDMSNARNELNAVKYPLCLETMVLYIYTGMEAGIQAFTMFMANENMDDVNSMLTIESTSLGLVSDEIKRINECVPNCKPK